MLQVNGLRGVAIGRLLQAGMDLQEQILSDDQALVEVLRPDVGEDFYVYGAQIDVLQARPRANDDMFVRLRISVIMWSRGQLVGPDPVLA
jgi:hypothetical protein